MRRILALFLNTILFTESEAQGSPALSLEVETSFSNVQQIERKKTEEGSLFLGLNPFNVFLNF